MRRCTVRWRVRCGASTSTSSLSRRTYRPSIRSGHFSRAAIASISRASIRRASTSIAAACAARASFTTRSRIAGSSLFRSICGERWRRAGIAFRANYNARQESIMAIDYSHAPHAWEKEKSNFVALLDLKLESVEHGGAIVSLCDTVFYVALASIYGRDQETTTVALQCNFLAPAGPPNDLVAEARVLRGGRRIVYGEVYVRSGEKIVAHATLDFLNTYPEEKPKK